ENYLEIIQQSATRMYNLLNSLIEYSRLDATIKALEPVDLNAIFQSAMKDWEQKIEESGAKVIVGALPKLKVVPGQIEVVLRNLIGNSLKYKTERAVPEIRFKAEKRNAEWLFSFADNGIGFDPGEADKIFIMFERLHATSKYPGVGMGLAI